MTSARRRPRFGVMSQGQPLMLKVAERTGLTSVVMRRETLVTGDGWNCGTMSGAGITGVILQPFKYRGGLKFQHAEAYGRTFATQDSANAYALEHGYLQVYRARVWCREHRCLHAFLGRPSPTFGACLETGKASGEVSRFAFKVSA